MHLLRLGALCAVLLGLAACLGPLTPRAPGPPPHMGDGTEFL
jgi:hypothetical protein